MPENNLNRDFSIVKMSAREVTVFPGKKTKLAIFHLRGCQLSKSNTSISFTCIKKNYNFTKETRYS